MHEPLAIPEILNDVARAGTAGLALEGNPARAEALDLCRRHGFSLIIDRGRAFLLYDDDSLVPAWIEQETPAVEWNELAVHGFLEIGSTNDKALKLARGGAPQGTLVCSERQTAGRGRRGRSWSSPQGAGIYSTLIVRPGCPSRFWPLFTHAASVALIEALKDVLGEACAARAGLDLKWPNDVLLSGKKVAGILLETASAGGQAGAAVVGVGINVGPASVPEDLRERATSVSEVAGVLVPRRLLLVRFLAHFQPCFGLVERGERPELLRRWMDRSSMWSGVPVWIGDGNRRRPAVTCGITELGSLRVLNEDGVEEELLAGDVSVRRE